MLPKQRQALILERVRKEGGVKVSDLVHELEVSDMTIRRDLELLAEQGLIDKVHGGATALELHSASEPGFAAKAGLQTAEKQAIAAAAAGLVGPGEAIAIGAGTTTYHVAEALLGIEELTVVTNSVPVAEVFHERGAGQTVILTGGLRTPSDALVGPVAVAALGSLHVDATFLGVHGMHPRFGFTTPNLLEAEANRSLIASAQRLVVVADHTKWGVIGMSTMALFGDADVLVTDEGLPAEAVEELGPTVGKLVLVPVPAGDTA